MTNLNRMHGLELAQDLNPILNNLKLKLKLKILKTNSKS